MRHHVVNLRMTASRSAPDSVLRQEAAQPVLSALARVSGVGLHLTLNRDLNGEKDLRANG